MTKGGVMIGRIESARSSVFIGMRVRSGDQREGEAEQRGEHADQRSLATVFQATPQFRAPMRQSRPQIEWLNSFVRNRRWREAAVIVAHRRGQNAQHRVEHEQRDQADDEQERSDDEHVALAAAEPRQAIGKQHEAGERVERRRPSRVPAASGRSRAVR